MVPAHFQQKHYQNAITFSDPCSLKMFTKNRNPQLNENETTKNTQRERKKNHHKKVQPSERSEEINLLLKKPQTNASSSMSPEQSLILF